MLKVNLQEKMIAGKVKSLDEDLAIKEFESIIKTNTEEDLKILSKLGMDHNIKIAKQKQEDSKYFNGFDNSRIFHISEIEKICAKYGLRFLSSKLYKGTIDPLLPSKIKEFNKEYKGKYSQEFINSENSFIMAPKNSFILQPIPKDPLFFVELTDDHYYLVHKWGNDLSRLRFIFRPLKRVQFCIFLSLVFAMLFSIFITYQHFDYAGNTLAENLNWKYIFRHFYYYLPIVFYINWHLGRACLGDEYRSGNS